jgi:hypothetical protein
MVHIADNISHDFTASKINLAIHNRNWAQITAFILTVLLPTLVRASRSGIRQSNAEGLLLSTIGFEQPEK